MLFKKNLGNHRDQIKKFFLLLDDVTDNEIIIPNPNIFQGDPSKSLMLLQSEHETDILRAYSEITNYVNQNYDFPQEYIGICLDHTISLNKTIAQTSQDFLNFLFHRHPMKGLIFNLFDPQNDLLPPYFQALFGNPFLGASTCNYIISIFKSNDQIALLILSSISFYDAYFSSIFKSNDFLSEDFFGRVLLIKKYILLTQESMKFNISPYFFQKIIELIIFFFENLQKFDVELAKIFLFLTSYCANQNNDEWLIYFVSDNNFQNLIGLYSNDNYPINLYVAITLCGISSTKTAISSKIPFYDLIRFFDIHFSNCINIHIQSSFVHTSRNLVLSDDAKLKSFTLQFIKSQFFMFCVSYFHDAPTDLKKQLIKLFGAIADKIKVDFIPIIIENNLIQICIDALYLESESAKNYIIKFLCIYAGKYDQTKDQTIQEMLTNLDLVEAVDDYLTEYDSIENDKIEARELQRVLYEINDCSY